MKKMLQSGLLVLILASNIGIVKANTDIVFVDRMMISNAVEKNISHLSLPIRSSWTFRNTDKVIFYYANIGVINSSKKNYDLEITCIDMKGNTVITKKINKNFTEFLAYHVDRETLRNGEVTLTLNPKSGAMVKGQLKPLENDKNYFIKVFFEKKLVGVTEFHYLISE